MVLMVVVVGNHRVGQKDGGEKVRDEAGMGKDASFQEKK